MNFQGVVSNVTDLERSIDFYCDVLGFTLLSRKEQLAAVNAFFDAQKAVSDRLVYEEELVTETPLACSTAADPAANAEASVASTQSLQANRLAA